MKQTFIVTIEADAKITSREVADALNFGSGCFALEYNHDEIIVAKARKINKDKKKTK